MTLTLLQLRKILVVIVAWLSVTTAFAQQPWPLWESYKEVSSDHEGRIIDRDAEERTTSEAQAYGLFFALVADDRQTFEEILVWTADNLAEGDLSVKLPAWLWGRRKNGSWGVLDHNPASDADVWMSYTLLQAGRLWNEPAYTALGKAMAMNVEREEVLVLPGLGPMLLPSSTGFGSQGQHVLNPSYLPAQTLTALANALPEGPWASIAAALPAILRATSSRGFAMDWVASGASGRIATVKGPGEIAGGSYDAIRVYLWAGMMDVDASHRGEILQAVPGMAHYLRSHPYPPERAGADGSILSPVGNVGFSAALIPYLSALGEDAALATQRTRLAEEFDPRTGLLGKDHRYYTQNLALFATGWSEGRFRFDRNGNLLVSWSKS